MMMMRRIDWLSVPVCQRKVLAANLVSNKSGCSIKTLDIGESKSGQINTLNMVQLPPFGGMGVTDALACV